MVLSSKIGIITFHNAINYGAALQAYAQQKFLINNRYDAEVIDYQCEKFKNDYRTVKLYDHSIKGLIKALFKAPSTYQRNKKFRTFLKNYVKCSKKSYDAATVGETNNQYELFIAGSDQVWNLALTGMDRNYLLNFVDENKKKSSYAASIGSVDLDSEMKAIFQEDIGSFDSISVREDDAKKFLQELLEKNVCTVLDPVFLLDATEWNRVARQVSRNDYILVYCLHEHSVYEQAKKLSEVTGLRIICIQNNMKKPIVAEYILNADPSEFVGYIRNAKYVVTDSFHGAAFGIIYRKQIRIVLKKILTGLNGRLLTLLNGFDLMEVIVDDDISKEALVSEINYNEEVINQRIKSSRVYLLNLAKEHIS